MIIYLFQTLFLLWVLCQEQSGRLKSAAVIMWQEFFCSCFVFLTHQNSDLSLTPPNNTRPCFLCSWEYFRLDFLDFTNVTTKAENYIYQRRKKDVIRRYIPGHVAVIEGANATYRLKWVTVFLLMSVFKYLSEIKWTIWTGCEWSRIKLNVCISDCNTFFYASMYC